MGQSLCGGMAVKTFFYPRSWQPPSKESVFQGAAIRAINSMEVALLGLLLLVGGTWVPQAAGLRILVVHPLYAGSHVLTLQSVTAELLKHGHSVTTVKFQDTNLPPLPTSGHPNFTLVHLSINNSLGELPFTTTGEQAQFRLPLELIWGSGQNLLWTIKMMAFGQTLFARPAPVLLQTIFCENILGDYVGNSITKDPTPYDIAIVDLMFNECGLALAHRLGVPAVGYWAFSFSSGWQEFTTQPAPPSFVPAFMSGLGSKMTLGERLQNMVARIAGHAFMLYYQSLMDSIIAPMSPNSPSSYSLVGNLSGMLLNTDMVLDYPRPQPPTFLNIGGIQVKENPGPLPENIKTFMEGAKDGVVLFTMGFIFDSTAVPKEMITNLLSAFERLPQRVIFKYDIQDDDTGYGSSPKLSVPQNVLVLPWVPQQAILAHPATKVFITHCGMHGVLEAIYHQVPMVGMPVFIDQKDVLKRMEEKGVGRGVPKGAPADEIHAAIVEVRDNPWYKKNIASLSRLMKDRRTRPMDDAVWLVEYVARTKGAEHLKVNSRHLGMLAYYSVDVLAILATLLVLTTYSLYHLLPHLLRACCGSRKMKVL